MRSSLGTLGGNATCFSSHGVPSAASRFLPRAACAPARRVPGTSAAAGRLSRPAAALLPSGASARLSAARLCSPSALRRSSPRHELAAASGRVNSARLGLSPRSSALSHPSPPFLTLSPPLYHSFSFVGGMPYAQTPVVPPGAPAPLFPPYNYPVRPPTPRETPILKLL